MDRSPDLMLVDPHGTIEKEAIETGFLFSRSINYYEQRNRDELLKKGYREGQIDLADRVLARFGTSVGANLERCPPELWCVRPCTDCGEDVDNREFNAIPRYGVVLCPDDTRKRDEKRICTECGGRFQDPAITEGLSALVRPHFFFEEIRHVCDWCALTLVKGDTNFIRNRGASDSDYKDLKKFIDQLGIRKKRNSIFPTPEEHKKLVNYVKRFEWYFDEKPGAELGEEWKDYYVTYTGVVVGKGDKPRPEVTIGPGWYIWHPKDERKLVWICRVRVLYKSSRAYVEIRFKDPSKPTFDIISANEINSQKELLNVWKGRGVVYRIREKSGTPYEYDDAYKFFDDAVSAYVTVFKQRGTDRVRIEDVAAAMLISRTTFYDTAKRLGIKLKQVRSEAKKQYKRIMEEHLSV